MKLKRHIEFIKENISIHKGDFTVTSEQVSNGMLIKDMIPREVTGDFDCSELKLTTLTGCPKEVTGNFDCSSNLLTNLEGCPKDVGFDFDCSDNELTSLEGIPMGIEGSFYFRYNLLTSLEGGPSLVGFDFDCSNNELTSLKGSPKEVGVSFSCNNNKLISLEYGPKGFSDFMYVDEDLEIEKTFIESGKHKDNYWMDLLKYMIDNKLELTEVKSWPKDFLNDELIQSTKGISKFNL